MLNWSMLPKYRQKPAGFVLLDGRSIFPPSHAVSFLSRTLRDTGLRHGLSLDFYNINGPTCRTTGLRRIRPRKEPTRLQGGSDFQRVYEARPSFRRGTAVYRDRLIVHKEVVPSLPRRCSTVIYHTRLGGPGHSESPHGALQGAAAALITFIYYPLTQRAKYAL